MWPLSTHFSGSLTKVSSLTGAFTLFSARQPWLRPKSKPPPLHEGRHRSGKSTASLPVPRKRKREYIKMFASSRMAYGWVVSRPSAFWAKKYDSAVFRCLDLSKASSRPLRQVLLGADLCTAPVILQRSMGIMLRRFKKTLEGRGRMPKWQIQRGTHSQASCAEG